MVVPVDVSVVVVGDVVGVVVLVGDVVGVVVVGDVVGVVAGDVVAVVVSHSVSAASTSATKALHEAPGASAATRPGAIRLRVSALGAVPTLYVHRDTSSD